MSVTFSLTTMWTLGAFRSMLAAKRASRGAASRYARHNSIHVAIKICLGEVQRLNGI